MFNEHMALGHDQMRKGAFVESFLSFEHAFRRATSPDERASALQMQGVVLRLLGKLETSRKALELALVTAEDIILKARITRDLGMTCIALEDYDLAHDILGSSYWALINHHEPIEAAMSRGFQGRVKLLQGSRKQAVSLLREADKVLHGGDNRDYELNNLIWLMRASHLVRFTGLPRAIRLVKQTGQSRRWKELAVIVIGGDWLYRILRKHG